MPLYSSTENGLDTRSASKAYAIHDFATHVASFCCLAIVNHKGQPTLNCGAKIRSALSSRSAIQPLLQSLQTSTVTCGSSSAVRTGFRSTIWYLPKASRTEPLLSGGHPAS